MKRIFHWMIILTMTFGALSLSSCDDQLKNDMMTPGGIAEGSGGGGGTTPGGGGGGGTTPGGGGGTSSDPYNLADYLHMSQWEGLDDSDTQLHTVYFYSSTVTYIKKEPSYADPVYFTGSYTINNLILTFKFTKCFVVDDYGNQTTKSLSNYSYSTKATLNSDLDRMDYDGHMLKQIGDY